MSGASANDPSSLVVYTAAGARFGVGMAWTMLLILPMTSILQELSARIARGTGRGFAANLRRFFPRWLLGLVVCATLFSNVVTIAADLNAMGAVARILFGGPELLYVAGFGALIAVLQVRLSYRQFSNATKIGALLVGAYVVMSLVYGVPWTHLFNDRPATDAVVHKGLFLMVVALMGTTISPYMYFWQASLEAEETRIGLGERNRLIDLPRLRFDTFLGMALASAIGLVIVLTSGYTLHAHGVVYVPDAKQAVQALRSVGGPQGHLLFAAAIVASGIMGIPMLSGSAGFAVAEWRRWKSGINHRARHAAPFYGVILLAIGLGVVMNVLPVGVVEAQILSGLIGAVAVVPTLVTMMLLVGNRRIMRTMVAPRWLLIGGWVTTATMAVASVISIVAELTGA